MRVALFHNRYRQRGGEDAVVEFEAELLRSVGIETFVLELDNEEVFNSPGLEAAKALWNAHSNPKSEALVTEFLADTKATVGHVHNWFPLISPSIYSAHKKLGVPVVQTLHNFRMGCGSGTFSRDSKACDLCLNGDRSNGVRNACYRGSKPLSWLWKRAVDKNWTNGTFTEDVSMYIAPTQYVADRHEHLGIPPEKMRVVMHGVKDLGRAVEPKWKKEGALFVGRLTEQKGVRQLLEAFEGFDVPLTIVGAGPEEERVIRAAAQNPNIEFRGHLSRNEVLDALTEHALLVAPHVGPETFGLAIVEAMAAHRPVVTSDLGGPSETVVDGRTGFLLEPGNVDQLRATVKDLVGDADQLTRMGRAARKRYELNLRPDAHLTNLLEVFDEVSERRQTRLRYVA